jgi:hypothetical protein
VLLVLLLALLVPGAHTEAHASAAVTVADGTRSAGSATDGAGGSTGGASPADGTAVEQDVPDAALRPPARPGAVGRAVVRLRPTSRPETPTGRAQECPAPVSSPCPPCPLHVLRCVVLRC